MPQQKPGFTLIELLVSVFIFSILISLAIPAWQHLQTKNQTQAVVNKLVTAINFARQQALMKHEVIKVCGSSDKQHCNGRWSSGVIVINHNNKVIYAVSQFPKHSQLSWRGFPARRYLQFFPVAMNQGHNGTFLYCPPQAKSGKAIVLNKNGRIKIEPRYCR